MKKIYDKDGDFHKEIEVSWDSTENLFYLTKWTVFGKDNSPGQSMRFSKREMQYLRRMFND